jgi:hypothetical protein
MIAQVENRRRSQAYLPVEKTHSLSKPEDDKQYLQPSV